LQTFHSRDAKKRPKQVALGSKYALLHNFLFAAVLKGQAQKTLFQKMLIQPFGAPEFQKWSSI
jgi:hypothetical protein